MNIKLIRGRAPCGTLVGMPASPPRLYGIMAARAPVAVIFRHGPKKWWWLGRWDLALNEVTPGAWFHGSLYPRRGDLSPDGELLYYFALKASGRPFLGSAGLQAYSAVSKAPWLFALAAWRESGTWTRGYHFIEGPSPDQRPWDIGAPDAGTATPLRARLGLAKTEPLQYACERRRGWIEHERCPPRDPGDVWDENRSVILAKPRPGGTGRLVLEDRGWHSNKPGMIEGRSPIYSLEMRKRTVPLEDVVWADWDSLGRLLVATAAGRLQMRDPESLDLREGREHDLSALSPSPREAPKEAQRW